MPQLLNKYSKKEKLSTLPDPKQGKRRLSINLLVMIFKLIGVILICSYLKHTPPVKNAVPLTPPQYPAAELCR